LGSATTGFSFERDILFTSCVAATGKNIYVESDDLFNSVGSASFKYNYSSSLLKNTNELYGGESSSSLDVDLREYLCPLQNYSANGYFIYIYFPFFKCRYL
jgi:hypothetical protein